MEKITIQKDKLRAEVEKNRKNHIDKYEEAWNSWREKMIANMTIAIDSLKDPKQAKTAEVHVNLTRPEKHVDDYDRALKMIDLEVKDTLVLEEQEFAQLVMNDWGWERAFASTYNMSTGKSYGKFGV